MKILISGKWIEFATSGKKPDVDRLVVANSGYNQLVLAFRRGRLVAETFVTKDVASVWFSPQELAKWGIKIPQHGYLVVGEKTEFTIGEGPLPWSGHRFSVKTDGDPRAFTKRLKFGLYLARTKGSVLVLQGLRGKPRVIGLESGDVLRPLSQDKDNTLRATTPTDQQHYKESVGLTKWSLERAGQVIALFNDGAILIAPNNVFFAGDQPVKFIQQRVGTPLRPNWGGQPLIFGERGERVNNRPIMVSKFDQAVGRFDLYHEWLPARQATSLEVAMATQASRVRNPVAIVTQTGHVKIGARVWTGLSVAHTEPTRIEKIEGWTLVWVNHNHAFAFDEAGEYTGQIRFGTTRDFGNWAMWRVSTGPGSTKEVWTRENWGAAVRVLKNMATS